MKWSWCATFAVLAMMLGLANGPRIWAQQPPLPDENQTYRSEVGDELAPRRFSIELDINSKGVTLKLGAGLTAPEPTVVIDAVCPSIVPAYIQVLFERIRMSRLARLAFERFSGFEDRFGESEESSVMDPEVHFHEMRDRTIPLGLAQQATY